MSKQTVAACMAEMLAGYGVSHVFYLPAVLRRMLVEIERRTSIARVHAHSEAGAAYMADGYARASGRPGVCMAQIVGALNLCAGLRDAHLAHAPVIGIVAVAISICCGDSMRLGVCMTASGIGISAGAHLAIFDDIAQSIVLVGDSALSNRSDGCEAIQIVVFDVGHTT